MDFHEILPEHITGKMTNKSVLGHFKGIYHNYFPCGVHLRNISCIILVLPTLDMDI